VLPSMDGSDSAAPPRMASTTVTIIRFTLTAPTAHQSSRPNVLDAHFIDMTPQTGDQDGQSLLLRLGTLRLLYLPDAHLRHQSAPVPPTHGGGKVARPGPSLRSVRTEVKRAQPHYATLMRLARAKVRGQYREIVVEQGRNPAVQPLRHRRHDSGHYSHHRTPQAAGRFRG
jgi:hypothetical protein